MVQGVILYVHALAGGDALRMLPSRPGGSGPQTMKRRTHALSTHALSSALSWCARACRGRHVLVCGRCTTSVIPSIMLQTRANHWGAARHGHYA